MDRIGERRGKKREGVTGGDEDESKAEFLCEHSEVRCHVDV